MNTDIDKAVNVLKQGGIVIFPTDTAFGIGCRIDNERAIERLFKIRKRPIAQAMPVLVSSVDMARDYLLEIPYSVEKLIKKYWPGPLTIILRCRKEKAPPLVRGGGDTLGVRMPDNSVSLALIKGAGVPILGPSANFHGEKTPYNFKDLDPELVRLVDYAVPGDTGSIGKPSTVIDCSISPFKILRYGAVKLKNYKSKAKNKTILVIDTSNREKISVGLNIDGKKYIFSRKVGTYKAQALLPLLDKLLKNHRLGLSDINAIEINKGPGSFTGLRVGIAVANALSFILKIPINGEDIGKLAEPVYK